ncbi:hypothetical protein BD311DRAFT_774425 [Dichomitus squalens]|uniref:Uncharacterized protein n=1 Tax=Dichomitus squalens TaxID=114155 RepID=A0A4Q9N3G8_9APHY|nr:hypothetical protein BD311DRAFT_774425 [Dichomitus squalens]
MAQALPTIATPMQSEEPDTGVGPVHAVPQSRRRSNTGVMLLVIPLPPSTALPRRFFDRACPLGLQSWLLRGHSFECDV